MFFIVHAHLWRRGIELRLHETCKQVNWPLSLHKPFCCLRWQATRTLKINNCRDSSFTWRIKTFWFFCEFELINITYFFALLSTGDRGLHVCCRYMVGWQLQTNNNCVLLSYDRKPKNFLVTFIDKNLEVCWKLKSWFYFETSAQNSSILSHITR